MENLIFSTVLMLACLWDWLSLKRLDLDPVSPIVVVIFFFFLKYLTEAEIRGSKTRFEFYSLPTKINLLMVKFNLHNQYRLSPDAKPYKWKQNPL